MALIKSQAVHRRSCKPAHGCCLQAGLAGLPAMGKGCRLSRAQRWRPPWTLEVWTASLEKSLRRHLVLQCCPQWIVARLTLTLQKRHVQRSVSLLIQLAK